VKTCKPCPHSKEGISVGFTVVECQKAYKVISVLIKPDYPPIPNWCPMNEVHPTILETLKPFIPPPTDTQRIDWLLDVITGGDTAEADRKTYTLAKAMMTGLEGRALIDKAMSL
jgi:hypothetical protein